MYPGKDSSSGGLTSAIGPPYMRFGAAPAWYIWFLCILLLIFAGIGYRAVGTQLKRAIDTPIVLPRPLALVPLEIGSWHGKDLSIPSTTMEYMQRNFADDFLSRRYVNALTNSWVDIYVVYCSSRPGGILGHQPRVCYPGYGWIHDGTQESAFVTLDGHHIRCLIHRFHKPAPMQDEVVVLSFYILNGQITTEESDFSGLLGRRPNIAGNPARYVAQVQISSALENSVRTAAKDMTDIILDFLPGA